jgi:hypothetical protein
MLTEEEAMLSKGNGGRPIAAHICQYKDGIEVTVKMQEGSSIEVGEVIDTIAAHLAEMGRQLGMDVRISEIGDERR